jgi:hypothetical protein
VGLNRNLATALRARRRDACPMRAFDRLPRELRLWLHEAALPWSPRSAARAWARARASGEDPATALSRLEARRLAQERPQA